MLISDIFTLLELSRFGWGVLCGQSYYSEQGGYQEIGKKNKQTKIPAQRKPREEGKSTSLPASLSIP